MNTAANKLTLFRIAVIPVFLLLMYLDCVYFALAVYIIACVSDFFDGRIARSRNQVTSFGKFMDPLADKLLVISAMCYFIETGTVPAWVVVIVLVREFAVSGLRLIAIEQGVLIAAAVSGKVKTVTTMIAVGFLIALNEPWMPFKAYLPYICCGAILLTTLYSGIEYFIKNAAVLRHCD